MMEKEEEKVREKGSKGSKVRGRKKKMKRDRYIDKESKGGNVEQDSDGQNREGESEMEVTEKWLTIVL